MANITELNSYDENVYLIDINDQVIGGADGISNKQAKSLANRTNWLKNVLNGFIDTFNAFILTVYTKTQSDANAGGSFTRVIPIGVWDMDTVTSISVALPTEVTNKVIDARVSIKSRNSPYDLYNIEMGGSWQVTNDTIYLTRFPSGFFDGVSFNNTDSSRGWIIIKYLP